MTAARTAGSAAVYKGLGGEGVIVRKSPYTDTSQAFSSRFGVRIRESRLNLHSKDMFCGMRYLSIIWIINIFPWKSQISHHWFTLVMALKTLSA